MKLTIARRSAGAECAPILAEQPEWFGLPQSNAAYAAAAEHEAWVAEQDGQTLGLMMLTDTGFAAVDVHLLPVRPHAHRQGVGRALIRKGDRREPGRCASAT
jgi:GNAT superfamily N-acetyltransferase